MAFRKTATKMFRIEVHMFRNSVLALSAIVTLVPSLSAQTTARVFYRDRTAKPERNSDFVGTVVEETVNGIKLKPQVGPDRTFSVNDIIDVAYDPPKSLVITFQPILGNESALRSATGDVKPKMMQLAKDYAAFSNTLKDEKAVYLRRHIQFRIAALKAGAADTREAQLAAIAALEKFRKDNLSGWQIIPAARSLVQLLGDVERHEDAAKVLEETSRSPGLAVEVKQELELTLIDTLIRAGKLAEVKGRLAQALATLPATDPLAAKLKVYQLGTQANEGDIAKLADQLKAIIDQTQDPHLKALAYNTLGDCYSAKGLKKEAMWQFLWVDVVYNQDRGELAKAVDRLAKVFKDLNDDQRSQKYQEKLKSLR